MPDSNNIAAPLELHTETVRPEWIDHNGHMNVAYYVLAFDEAAGSLSKYLGIGKEYRANSPYRHVGPQGRALSTRHPRTDKGGS
jgi:acyl-CoA thioesterase FadM